MADPTDGGWIECVSQSWRLDVFPFASALRKLRTTDTADDGVQDAWAEDVLASQPARLSKKREAKKQAALAQRKRDGDPRPAPPADPQPPQPAPPAAVADEFRVVSPDEELWNAT